MIGSLLGEYGLVVGETRAFDRVGVAVELNERPFFRIEDIMELSH